MSVKTNPLAAVEAMEAAAFRTGHMARRLLAEHPDLSVREIRLGYVSGGKAELEIDADTCDAARAWADRLGLDVELKTSSYKYDNSVYEVVYEACHAKGLIDGVSLDVSGTRSVEGAEREAWIAAGAQGAEDGDD
jgi:hypothetical protein